MPDCLIVIVNWNSWDYLFPCLDALQEQTVNEFQIFVVDNASSDQSRAESLKNYPNLTFIQNSENVGFAAANNQAIHLAEGCEWIVLLNPDTIPAADWLEKLIKTAETHPDYSFFGSRLVMAEDPSKLDGAGDVYHMSGLTWRFGHGMEISSISSNPHEIFSPCAAAAMYRRENILAVGGFDEDFFCYSEDVDLGFRLRLAGHRALSVPESVVKHHGSATTSKRSDFAVYYGHRNLVWTWVKDMPLILLILFLPVHLVYNVSCIFLYIFRGQGRVILGAKFDALLGLPKILTKRKKVFAGQHVSSASIWRLINKSFFIGPGSKYRKSV